jgi:hypothetical protein
MNLLRTTRLMVVAAIFISGLFVTASMAQPGRASWYGNNGRHLGWTNGRHRGWYKNRGWNDRRVAYYRPVRYRYYGYRNYYPSYGYSNYGSGFGSSILSSLGLGNLGYRNYGYSGRYYRGDKERRKWLKKYYKHHRRWRDDD